MSQTLQAVTPFLIILITFGGFVFGIVQGIVKHVQKSGRASTTMSARPKFDRVEKERKSRTV